jgi:hypothetical protein
MAKPRAAMGAMAMRSTPRASASAAVLPATMEPWMLDSTDEGKSGGCA